MTEFDKLLEACRRGDKEVILAEGDDGIILVCSFEEAERRRLSSVRVIPVGYSLNRKRTAELKSKYVAMKKLLQ